MKQLYGRYRRHFCMAEKCSSVTHIYFGYCQRWIPDDKNAIPFLISLRIFIRCKISVLLMKKEITHIVIVHQF